MLKMKKILFALPALVLAFSIVTVTAYAHDGPHDEGTTLEANSSEEQRKPAEGSQTSNEGQAPEDKARTKRAELERRIHSNEDKFRKSGDDLLTDLKNRSGTRTAEQRQQACQTRKQGLQTKVDNLDRNAQKHQKRIDEIFAKVVAYQKEKNLSIDNFDNLVAAATAAQSQAEASVSALANLKPTLDCNKDSVASDVAAFKAAAEQARGDISAYKNAVKELLKAAQAAKA